MVNYYDKLYARSTPKDVKPYRAATLEEAVSAVENYLLSVCG